jgi:hypothetical protein
MKGYPNLNFPAFDAATVYARANGWHVLSPAEFDRAAGFDGSDPNAKFDMEAAIDRDIAAIRSLKPDNGDAIAMLPGWEMSKGALGELGIAKWMNLTIIDAQTLLPFADDVAPQKKNILELAQEATGSNRPSIYGHPILHFTCTAAMVTAYLVRRGWTPPPGEKGLMPEDWPQVMALDKQARQAGNLTAHKKLHIDSLVDTAGYARTAEMLSELSE